MKIHKFIIYLFKKKKEIHYYNEYLDIVKSCRLENNYITNYLEDNQINTLIEIYPFLSNEAKKIIENTIFKITLPYL